MATIISHEEDESSTEKQINTTNLGLKSLAYNNYRSYKDSIDKLTQNTYYFQNISRNITATNNIIVNLSTATSMLISLVKIALKNKGYISQYNNIRNKYGLKD